MIPEEEVEKAITIAKKYGKILYESTDAIKTP